MPTHSNLPRALSLQGGRNFRDIGGYQGHDGRTVRWRKLFRSAHLADLTHTDISALSGLGLRRVCDLRGVEERALAVCAIPDAHVHSLPIEPTIVQRLNNLREAGHALSVDDTVNLMRQTYRGFVENETTQFAMLFEHLLASDEPVVFHCTAGKDRTGFAAAMILSALGVGRDTVLQDYLLTNEVMPSETAERAGVPPEIVAIYYRVREAFLAASFEALEAGFGSVEGYLRNGLGLTTERRERLATLYLE